MTETANAPNRQGVSMEWQPIETAPVATRLMFWWRPIKPNPYAECCVVGNLCYKYDTGERNGKWWNDALGGEQDIWHLTHWMPLPEAPNEKVSGVPHHRTEQER